MVCESVMCNGRKCVAFQLRPALWPAVPIVAALLLYGSGSQPAPIEFGWVEMLVGGLLLVCVSPRAIWRLLCGGGESATTTHLPFIQNTPAVVSWAFYLLLWPPLLRGIWMDAPAWSILRDVISLLFLFLPFVWSTPNGKMSGSNFPVSDPPGSGPPGYGAPDHNTGLRHASPMVQALTTGLILAGILFAGRWWHEEAHWGFGAIGLRAFEQGMANYLNSPTVLLAGITLPFIGFALATPHPAPLGRTSLGRRWLGIGMGALCGIAALLCLGALAAAVHRAALLLIILAGIVFVIWSGQRSPWGLLLLVAGFALLLTWLPEPVPGVIAHLIAKSHLVGDNTRIAELEAVLEVIRRNLPAFLLGDGWGAAFVNPAVGGWRVTYTHNFLSYLLLKAGVVGLVGGTLWLAALGPAIWRLGRRLPLPTFLLLLPLLPSLLLHASFKYLCFGLLVTLIFSISNNLQDCQKGST